MTHRPKKVFLLSKLLKSALTVFVWKNDMASPVTATLRPKDNVHDLSPWLKVQRLMMLMMGWQLEFCLCCWGISKTML